MHVFYISTKKTPVKLIHYWSAIVNFWFYKSEIKISMNQEIDTHPN